MGLETLAGSACGDCLERTPMRYDTPTTAKEAVELKSG